MSTDAIALKNITKRFGAVTAVDSVSLTIQVGEFFSLLGPSGCGKTTLLRLIAGFEEPDTGDVLVQARSMRGIPPQKRPVNTVFQHYALFPHLTVFENVAFGLRMRNTPKAELERRVGESMELTHVPDLGARFPHQLSGGQKQRVSLARALVNEPSVLLLDEPLAAIDAKLRAQLQTDLRDLQRQLKTTFLYVTHDQDEALALSDRIAVMQNGRLAQVGTPQEVYERPRNRFVASFLGACNILSGTIQPDGKIQTPIGVFAISGFTKGTASCHVGIRRENIVINESPNENTIPGRITAITYSGPQTEYTISIQNTPVRALETSHARTSALTIGATAHLYFPPELIRILEED